MPQAGRGRIGTVTTFTLALIVPLARWWVDAQQARILAGGAALTEAQREDARHAGVLDAGRVRVLCVPAIPLPLGPVLPKLSSRARLFAGETTGITLGHGIYIRDDFARSRRLLVHELVHVAQYERHRGTAGFLRAYLGECLSVGYPNGSLEQEAVVRTREICG